MNTTHRKHLFPLMALLLCLLLAGCAAQQHINDAQRYMRMHDYASAVTHYRQALRIKPELAKDPKFMTDYHDAARENALAASRVLISSDQADQAVVQVEAALREIPGDPQLLTALRDARHAAADSLHHKALRDADAGNLDAAMYDLQQALKYNPQHDAVTTALRSLTEPNSFPPTMLAIRDAALQSMHDRQWAQAADQWRVLIAQSPDFLPARAEVRTVSQQIALVESRLGAAMRASGNKQLDAAINELQAGLAIWPEHAASLKLLDDVVGRRKQATDYADKAADLLAKHDYDQAIAAAGQARALFPTYADAIKIETMARRSAADDAVLAGRAALGKSDYVAANASFNKALLYLPKMDEAISGLASVATAQGDDAEKAGRIGLSLLYRMKADQYAPNVTNLMKLAEAQKANFAKGAFTLVIDSRNADATVTANSVPLVDAMLPILRGRASKTMTVNPTPLANDRPVFHSSITVVRNQVTLTMTSQQQLSQTYLVPVKVPNDQLPVLRKRAHEAREAYEQASEFARQIEDGKRDYLKHNDAKTPGYAKMIDRINHAVADSRKGREEARIAAEQAVHELRHAPAFVIAQQARQWPYIVQHYKQVASLVATITLADAENHALVAPINISHEVDASDDTTLQPNPAIGVPVDELSLPAPEDMKREAIAQSAEIAANKLLAAAIATRAANLHAQADELAKSGHADQALEYRVAAALVTQAIDPKASAKMLAQLTREATD